MGYQDGSELVSNLTGNGEYPITQMYDEYNASTAPMYGYAESVGLAPGHHPGVDIGVPMLTPLYAPTDGEVTQTGFAPWFRPKPIYIRDKAGNTEIIGHAWEDAVETGDKVKAGDLIGWSGQQTTAFGNLEPDNTGPHVHFEVRNPDGMTIDPLAYLLAASGKSGGTSETGTAGKSKYQYGNTTGTPYGSFLTDTSWLSRIFILLVGFGISAVAIWAMVGKFTPEGRALSLLKGS